MMQLFHREDIFVITSERIWLTMIASLAICFIENLVCCRHKIKKIIFYKQNHSYMKVVSKKRSKY